MIYNPDWRNNTIEYITTEIPRQLAIKATSSSSAMGWQYFFGEKISGRSNELTSFTKIIIRARSPQEIKMKLSLITNDADAFSTEIQLSKNWQDIEIPLSNLQADSFLLLPRPYPGFLPLYFKSAGNRPFDITKVEKLEISFGGKDQSPTSIEVESVYFN